MWRVLAACSIAVCSGIRLRPGSASLLEERSSPASAMAPGSPSGALGGKVAPLIDTSSVYTPEVATESLQKLAEIFAKEPPAALGQAALTRTDDEMGLLNDPLDALGVEDDKPDLEVVSQEVARLKAEIQDDSKTAAGIPKKQAALENLEKDLATAKADSDAAKAKEDVKNQFEKQKKRKVAAQTQLDRLNQQITNLKKQLKSLSAEKAKWEAPIATGQGSATSVAGQKNSDDDEDEDSSSSSSSSSGSSGSGSGE